MKSVAKWAKFEQVFLFGQEIGGSTEIFLVPKIQWVLAQRIRAHFGTEIGRLRNLDFEQAVDAGFAGIRQKLAKLIGICQQIDKSLQLMAFIKLFTKTTTSQEKSGMMVVWK
ncbi:hypothetical protein niasHT_013352 [Heterodera trifolii]|uniref:Uncharacterized protein n=1 Tax=Heterodera trifolii TaxID=157864 RepID=A0ABD2L9A4_9BILA